MVLHLELRQRRRGWARSIWGTWYFMNFHVLWGLYNFKSHFGVPEDRSWIEISWFFFILSLLYPFPSLSFPFFILSLLYPFPSLSFPFFPAHKTAALWAECPSVHPLCICALFWNNTRERRMLLDHINAEMKPKENCKLILRNPPVLTLTYEH